MKVQCTFRAAIQGAHHSPPVMGGSAAKPAGETVTEATANDARMGGNAAHPQMGLWPRIKSRQPVSGFEKSGSECQKPPLLQKGRWLHGNRRG